MPVRFLGWEDPLESPSLNKIFKSGSWGGWWEGGSGWGTHVNPWLIHVNVWRKPLQYCKVISLQLIKIIGKKKHFKGNIKKKKKSGSYYMSSLTLNTCTAFGNLPEPLRVPTGKWGEYPWLPFIENFLCPGH